MNPSDKTDLGPAVPIPALPEAESALEGGKREAVLSVLEADQLVSAKERTRFGRRKLTPPTRVLLWALRVYVLLMFVLVVIQVLHALQGTAPK